MIINRKTVTSPSLIMPSVFMTSVEIATQLKAYGGKEFCVIPTKEFTPSLEVSKKGKTLQVTALPRANAQRVFDKKVTSARAHRIPSEYVFCFNIDGKVLSVSHTSKKAFSFSETKSVVASSGLSMVSHIAVNSKSQFINTLLGRLLEEPTDTPFDNVLRTGFHIGADPLRHTGKISISGILSTVFPLEATVRLKGIYKHAPEYSEIVFWFELKQVSATIYGILQDEELKATFMDGLIRCL